MTWQWFITYVINPTLPGGIGVSYFALTLFAWHYVSILKKAYGKKS